MLIPSGKVRATHCAREDGHDVYWHFDLATGLWCKGGNVNGPFQSVCMPPANRNRIRGARQEQHEQVEETLES